MRPLPTTKRPMRLHAPELPTFRRRGIHTPPRPNPARDASRVECPAKRNTSPQETVRTGQVYRAALRQAVWKEGHTEAAVG